MYIKITNNDSTSHQSCVCTVIMITLLKYKVGAHVLISMRPVGQDFLVLNLSANSITRDDLSNYVFFENTFTSSTS